MEHTISEIEKNFDLEIQTIITKIKGKKAKLVALQFPDGLKPYATTIAEKIQDSTGCKCIIWFGSCYGSCDIPIQLDTIKPKIDLLVHFGHTSWNYKNRNINTIQ